MNVTEGGLGCRRLAVLAAAVAGLPISGWSRPTVTQPTFIRGAVVEQEPEPAKQLPISDVDITADGNTAVSRATSDSSGFFSLSLRPEVKPGTPISLKFRSADYKPLDLNVVAGDEIKPLAWFRSARRLRTAVPW